MGGNDGAAVAKAFRALHTLTYVKDACARSLQLQEP